jgi:hypothetical protein
MQQQVNRRAPVPNAGQPLDGMHVLLVEDDEALRRLPIRMPNGQAPGAGVRHQCQAPRGHDVGPAVSPARDGPATPGGSGSTVTTRAPLEPPIAIAISGSSKTPCRSRVTTRLPKPFSNDCCSTPSTTRRYAVA